MFRSRLTVYGVYLTVTTHGIVCVPTGHDSRYTVCIPTGHDSRYSVCTYRSRLTVYGVYLQVTIRGIWCVPTGNDSRYMVCVQVMTHSIRCVPTGHDSRYSVCVPTGHDSRYIYGVYLHVTIHGTLCVYRSRNGLVVKINRYNFRNNTAFQSHLLFAMFIC